MVRFATVAAVLALMAAPLVAQESTEQLRKELESLRKEVDGMKADRVQYESKEVAGAAKVSKDGMAPEGDSPIMTALKNTKLSGFVDAGYVVSFNAMHNEAGNQQNGARAFDQLGNSFYLNAVQVNLESLATEKFIVGYHLELAAGHDVTVYDGTTVSLQEGWVQILAPVGKGLDIRVGKQATLVGYEVVESMNDMNYSRGLLFSQIQPVTATGVRASYTLNEMLSFTFGFNNGLNPAATVADSTFADTNHGKMLEFQVAVKSGDLSTYVNLNWGNEGAGGVGGNDQFYLFDIVAEYKMGKLTLALNLDFSAQHDAIGGNQSAPENGIALYAKYLLSDMLSEALRVEYYSDKNGVLFGPQTGAGAATGTDSGSGARIVSLTATTEFKIASQAIFRVELRHDQSNNHVFTRDGRDAQGDTTLGFEAIMPF